MRKISYFLVLVLALTLLGCNGPVKPTTPQGDETNFSHVEQGISIVNDLSKGNFNTVYTQFNDSLKGKLDENTLRGIWASFVKAYGKFIDCSTDIEPTKEKGNVTLTIPCNFERGTMIAQISFDKNNKISGIFFSAPPANKIPLTLENDLNVLIGEGQWQLPGSLTLPEGDGPFPVLILVHGSGPLDRNEQIGTNTPFMDIAEQLAKKGIATLRYDKRTFVYSEEMQKVSNLTVYDETIDDAVQAVKLMARSQNIDPNNIYVLGHSLGGMLIPRIAELTPEAAGYIILAGSSRPLEDLIMEQTKYILSIDQQISSEDKQKILTNTEKQATAVKNLQPETKLPPTQPNTPLFNLPNSYWLSLKGYEPAIEAKNITKPLLILHGERDYQVRKSDFNIWKQSLSTKDNVSFISYPNLNHLFMPGTGLSTPTEYTLKGTVDPTIIEDIAKFIQ